MAYRSYDFMLATMRTIFRHQGGAKSAHGMFTALSQGVMAASFSIAAEATNMVDVTISLTDEEGVAIAAGVAVDILILANSGGTDFTAGTYTFAAGALGKVATVVTNKIVKAITGTGGIVNLQITNTGAATCYVGVQLPTGRLALSAVVTHAA